VKHEVESLSRLKKFVPRYFGVVRYADGRLIDSSVALPPPVGVTHDAYLLLQRLSERFARPCIMDLKMGLRTYEPGATEDKMEREITKYPKQREFGFRITGMRIYDPSHAEADELGCRFFDKDYGRALETRESLLEAFRLFFSSGAGSNIDEEEENDVAPDQENRRHRLRSRVITNILLEVRSLRNWFEENRTLEFRASSLLLVYDGDAEKGTGDVAMLKMIDFGRVRRVAGGDPGYRFGLRTLKHLLTDILEEDNSKSAASTGSAAS